MLSSLPPAVKAGDEFNVELTINKGSINGFSELQQFLPEGFFHSLASSYHSSDLWSADSFHTAPVRNIQYDLKLSE